MVHKPVQGAEVVELPIESIQPSPFQPRTVFDETKLAELGNSIAANGLVQPIVVRQISSDPLVYELIAGERRLRASKLVGKETIEAVIKTMTDEEARENALIENIQRDDLTIIDLARSLASLVELHDGDRELVANKISKSVPFLAERLDLLTLPEVIQAMLEKDLLNLAVAKVILDLEPEKQVEAANLAAQLQLTANELRGRMQRHTKPPRNREKSKRDGATFNQLSTLLVKLYDSFNDCDFSELREENRRETLKKQIALAQSALENARNSLDGTFQNPLSSEGQESRVA
jgi:ParB family chromosome partitioning protein